MTTKKKEEDNTIDKNNQPLFNVVVTSFLTPLRNTFIPIYVSLQTLDACEGGRIKPVESPKQ